MAPSSSPSSPPSSPHPSSIGGRSSVAASLTTSLSTREVMMGTPSATNTVLIQEARKLLQQARVANANGAALRSLSASASTTPSVARTAATETAATKKRAPTTATTDTPTTRTSTIDALESAWKQRHHRLLVRTLVCVIAYRLKERAVDPRQQQYQQHPQQQSSFQHSTTPSVARSAATATAARTKRVDTTPLAIPTTHTTPATTTTTTTTTTPQFVQQPQQQPITNRTIDEDNGRTSLVSSRISFWKSIQEQVCNKMENHFMSGKSYPKLPPDKDKLPTGVYTTKSGTYKVKLWCPLDKNSRYLGTWKRPEHSAQAYLYAKELIKKATINKEVLLSSSLPLHSKKERERISSSSSRIYLQAKQASSNESHAHQISLNRVTTIKRRSTTDKWMKPTKKTKFSELTYTTTNDASITNANNTTTRTSTNDEDEDTNLPASIPSPGMTSGGANQLLSSAAVAAPEWEGRTEQEIKTRWKIMRRTMDTMINRNGTTAEQLNRVVYLHDYNGEEVRQNTHNDRWKSRIWFEGWRRSMSFDHQYQAIAFYRLLWEFNATQAFPRIPEPAMEDGATGETADDTTTTSTYHNDDNALVDRGWGSIRIAVTSQVDKEIFSRSNSSGDKNTNDDDDDDDATAPTTKLPTGVTQRPSGMWQAQIYCAGKTRYIGVWDKPQYAARAYMLAKEQLQQLKRQQALNQLGLLDDDDAVDDGDEDEDEDDDDNYLII